MDGDDGEFGSVEDDGAEDAGRPPTKRRRFFIIIRGASRRSLGSVVRASYDGRVSVL